MLDFWVVYPLMTIRAGTLGLRVCAGKDREAPDVNWNPFRSKKLVNREPFLLKQTCRDKKTTTKSSNVAEQKEKNIRYIDVYSVFNFEAPLFRAFLFLNVNLSLKHCGYCSRCY